MLQAKFKPSLSAFLYIFSVLAKDTPVAIIFVCIWRFIEVNIL